MNLPARGPLVADLAMLVSFDIDCGELVPGHHFVARGLATCEIPHPDDLAAWDDANPHPRAGSGGNYFISFRVPPDGFNDDDTSEEAILWRRSRSRQVAIDRARHMPGFTFHYDLVPGLTESELDAEGSMFPFLVEVAYTADRPLPWPVTDGGTLAPADGGPSTHGSRVAWPIPDGARILTFTLTGVDAETGYCSDEPEGRLIVDLSIGSARWIQTP